MRSIAVEDDIVRSPPGADCGDLARHEDLGAEALRLLQRAMGEIAARDPARKPR